MGRCCDSTTGQTYHPVYAPAPKGMHERLVWRVDDTTDVLQRRIADHKKSCEAIIGHFESASIPLRRFDNARSELETFEEIATFLVDVASSKRLSLQEEMLQALRRSDEADGWGEATSRRFGAYGGPKLQAGLLASA